MPIDLLDPNWETSSHRGAVVVRARDEASAREIAAKAFTVKTGFPAGHGTKVPPWTRPELVKVERLDDSKWQNYVGDGVLDPSFDLDLRSTRHR
jgi:hypothetical protein